MATAARSIDDGDAVRTLATWIEVSHTAGTAAASTG
jgi:hypothetical protein